MLPPTNKFYNYISLKEKNSGLQLEKKFNKFSLTEKKKLMGTKKKPPPQRSNGMPLIRDFQYLGSFKWGNNTTKRFDNLIFINADVTSDQCEKRPWKRKQEIFICFFGRKGGRFESSL